MKIRMPQAVRTILLVKTARKAQAALSTQITFWAVYTPRKA